MLLAIAGAGLPEGDDAKAEELLESALPWKREEGARLLAARKNTAAAKRLIGLLADRDWGVRMAAIRGLGTIRYGPGADALRDRALKGETRGIRHLAARMLKQGDAEAASGRIARRLTKLKKKQRLRPIEALGIIGGPAAVEALEKQMRAPDPTHRLAAAAALGRLHAGEQGLMRGLKDRKEDVSLTSATGLAGVDSDSAREAILDYVEKAREPREAYVLRRIGRNGALANRAAFAAVLCRRLEKTRSPGPLLQVAIFGGLDECGEAAFPYLKHRDPLVRAFAFRVAGQGGKAPPMDRVLGAIGHKDRRLRYAAAQALLDTAGEDLRVDALRTLLRHKHPDVALLAVRRAVEWRQRDVLEEILLLARRKTAAKTAWLTRSAACVAAGRIGYDLAFDGLKGLLKAREWWLRAAAVEGLYHSYTKEVIPILIKLFDERHPVVRMTVRRNLRYMTGKHYVQRKLYEAWWEKWGAKLELRHPEKKLAELDKYGYSTKKYLQDILRGTDIVAVKGRWDKVEKVLEDLDVKHLAVRAQEIKMYGLSPKQVVLVNCEGSVDSEVTKFLQWFVVTGGYMATTDWSLVNATTRTFPGVLSGYTKQSTGNDVVVVEPAAPGHPILKGVFRPEVELMWWLEIQAFPIQVSDPIRTTVLVDSLQMLVRYGSSAMMVEFPAGLGKVLHSTSHFYLQKEGFAHENDPLRRKIFAADNLGLSVAEIRELDEKGVFRDINDTTPISKSYSMFHLLVNFISEKQRIDLTR
jgi:HEAT repeat protein